jgi:uncharacterized protein YacL
MLLKNLMLIVSLFAGNQFADSKDTENKTILLVRKTLRTEILFIGFYLFTGLILSAVIVFSIIQAGLAFQTHLNQFANGTIIQILSFSIFAMVCLALLYFVLPIRSLTEAAEKKKIQKMSLQSTSPQIDFAAVGLHFADGFLKGFQSKNKQNNQQTKEN